MSATHPCNAPSPRMRFVRLNPRFDREETLKLLKSELQTDSNDKTAYPLPVPWLNYKEHGVEFFALPEDFGLNRSSSFRSGRVYGMDVTSGAAVAALLFDLYDVVRPDSLDAETGRIAHDAQTPIRVLDLCCAPGLKLCMMADLAPPASIVTGVDISSHRISLCKNIVVKYHIDKSAAGTAKGTPERKSATDNATETANAAVEDAESKWTSTDSTIRLYCTDGTTFGTKQSNATAPQNGLVFDSNAAKEEFQTRGKRKRMNKSARAREKRRLLELQRTDESANASASNEEKETGTTTSYKSITSDKGETASDKRDKGVLVCNATCTVPLFDRVLVDAECSTDGAMRHIEKRQSSQSLSRDPVWTDANMCELVDLQKRLIESGFRLLKRGGTMVYSTCSLSPKQNEQVVQWLLGRCNDACIIPVSFTKKTKPLQSLAFIEEGSVPGTIRFNPKNGGGSDCDRAPKDCILPGSGFYLAKIGKT
ncbi:hypothetical protein ACHAXT_004038 [Thalassiosira profunda]